jgi:hypothetical protein
MEFFGDVEEFASDLYPYRWPITIGVIILLAAMSLVAYRLGWHRRMWRHRLVSGVTAAIVLAVILPVGWYTLSPLWERSRLDEASPLAAVAAPMPGAEATATAVAPEDDTDLATVPDPPPFAPRVTHRGMFEGADDFHFGRGDALLIETAPGEYTLRFENFSVRNGPDLFVYLTADPESVDGALNLGDLRATDGNFNYEVPPGTDTARFRYAIVWCRQFATLFASAPLDAA